MADEDEEEWSIAPEDNPWRQHEVDTLKALYHQELYMHGDPFRHNVNYARPESDSDGGSSRGIGSDARGRLGRGDDVAAQWAEDARKQRLLEGCDGFQVWLRGQNPQSRLMKADEAEDYLERKKLLAKVKAGPTRTPVKVGASPWECWFRVERTGRATASFFEEELHEMSGVQCDSDENDILAAAISFNRQLDEERGQAQPVWCWRTDFVQEAKMAARGAGMRRATVTEYFPVTDKLIQEQGYVAASCSSGGREVWSPSFVNLLEALQARWGIRLDEDPTVKVKLSESEVFERQPWVHFASREPEPNLKAKTAPMPSALRHKLRDEGPPPTPAVPQRLPTRICYEQDLPWTKLLWKPALRPQRGVSVEPPVPAPVDEARNGARGSKGLGWNSVRKSASLAALGRLSIRGSGSK